MEINKDIVKKLHECNKVAIFVHINPDGDCIGSASALKQLLMSMGKTADIYSDTPPSDNYRFIKFVDEIKTEEYEGGYDLHIAVDCSDLRRVGKYSTDFNKLDNTVCIDHHKTNDGFAKVTHVEIVSSAALMMYYYVKELGKLNADIATAIYAGISSDTGCYLHSNTTSLEHTVTAELIDYGFDLDYANRMLFKYTTLAKFELTKRALGSAEFFANGKVGILKLTKKDLEETNADISDTTGLVNEITNVNCCEVGIIIYEQERGLFRCSLRSKSAVDVSVIANQFGGGGHERAAGCNIFGCLKTAKNKIVSACVKEVHKVGL